MRRLLALAAAAAAIGVAAAVPAGLDDNPAVRHDRFGCVVATDTLTPVVHLVFSADSMFEGAPTAIDAMRRRGVRASFFFTGNFLRDSANDAVVRRIIADGHYVGPHSDRHLLLADWDGRRTTLVSADSLLRDLDRNYAELQRHGVSRSDARIALPPYEWCNAMQAAAYRSAGVTPVNPTPEIETYRDYTLPGMPEYKTSAEMLGQLYAYERARGLNGAIIILHLGTRDERTDKLYDHLGAIIDTLTVRGYRFATLYGQ